MNKQYKYYHLFLFIMYNNYVDFLQSENTVNTPFKSHSKYTGILEHVNPNLGNKYLSLILNEFPTKIRLEKIISYCDLNDRYGSPIIREFTIAKSGEESDIKFKCSPTSLRYIYHALTILTYYEEQQCKNIVEVGCGYGGLCLAINFFMNDFNIDIENYHIIDLKEPVKLINSYLTMHKKELKTKLFYHNSSTFGSNIHDKNLFFISNYCYTEIDTHLNKQYTTQLLTKVSHGFITWQNGGNNHAYPIENAESIINHKIIKTMGEKPQTDAGHGIYKNFFVYF